MPSTAPQLNVDVLVELFKQLDARDLARAAQVNRMWRQAAADDRLWANLCVRDWLVEEPSKDCSWYQTYLLHNIAWHRYEPQYARVKRAWNRLEAFLRAHFPLLLTTLRPGCTEEELDTAEEKLGVHLPLDLRCSYRIHNGQRFSGLPLFQNDNKMHFLWGGLFGSVLVYNKRVSIALSEIGDFALQQDNIVRFACQIPEKIIRFSVVCERQTSTISASEASTTTPGATAGLLPTGTILHPAVTNDRKGSAFILAPSFASFFMDFVTKVCDGYTTILPPSSNFEIEGIDRHLASPIGRSPLVAPDGIIYGSETITEGVHIRVQTSFNGESSQLLANERILNFSYRVSMWMDNDGPRQPLQLLSRHWRIHNADGSSTPVDGLGVIGFFPVLSPGGEPFHYCSQTTFPYPKVQNELAVDLQQNGHSTLFEQENTHLPYTNRQSTRNRVSLLPSTLVGTMEGWFTFVFVPRDEVDQRDITVQPPNTHGNDLVGDFSANISPFRLVSPALAVVNY